MNIIKLYLLIIRMKDIKAISLLELRGFKSSEFKSLHPGGNLGKDLKNLSEIMHIGTELPLANNM